MQVRGLVEYCKWLTYGYGLYTVWVCVGMRHAWISYDFTFSCRVEHAHIAMVFARHEPFKWHLSEKAAIPEDPEAFFRQGHAKLSTSCNFEGPEIWRSGDNVIV